MQVQSMLNPYSQHQPTEDMAARLSHQQSSLRAQVNKVEQNAEMTLYTEEGDKVTLSMNNSLETAYARYSESGGMIGPGVMKAERKDMQISQVGFEQEVGMTVEGDLSKEELKDIKKAVKAMGRMMRDFMSGDTGKMAKRALRVKGLETVSGLEVSLGYEKSSVTLEQTRQTTEATLVAPLMPVSDDADDHDDLDDRLEDLTERMMTPVREREMDGDHLTGAINRMFGEFDDDDAEEGFEAEDFKELVNMIRSRFFEKLGSVLSENGARQGQLSTPVSETD